MTRMTSIFLSRISPPPLHYWDNQFTLARTTKHLYQNIKEGRFHAEPEGINS